MPQVAAALPAVLLNIGISLAVGEAVNLVSGLIAPASNQRSATTGAELPPRAGADVPVSAVLGWGTTQGTFWHQQSYGDDNEYVQIVYVCGRSEHEALTHVLADNKAVTLSHANTDPLGQVMEDWTVGGVAHAWVKYYTGAAGQTADPQLVAHADPPERWPDTKTLTGTAYVILTLRYSDTVFPSGIPSWRFVWKGIKAYDRRKDSSQPGGSGSHVWGDPSTYEWTDNPAILQDNWRLGIWVNGVRLLGLGVPEAAEHHARIVAAANLSDETVHYDDTDEDRARYSFGTEISDEIDQASVMRTFETAMGGFGAEWGGAYAPVPAQTMLPVMTLKDTHRVPGGMVDERTHLDPATVKTAYNGVFVSRTDGWVNKEYGLRFDASVESAEGGRRQGSLDLEMISYPETAGSVAEIFRRRDRFQKNETSDYGIAAAPLEAGDVVTRESALFGTIPMMVWKTEPLGNETYRLTLREWSNVIVPTPDAGFLPVPVDPIPAVLPTRPITVNGLLAVAASLPSGPSTVPVIRVTFSPITDRTVTEVLLKYYPTATPTDVRYQHVTGTEIANGRTVIEGVAPQTEYKVEATILTAPARVTTWAGPSTVTTSRLIIGDLADGVVSITKFASDISPPQVVDNLVDAVATEGALAVLTTDGRLYRYHSGVWTIEVPTNVLSGQIVNSQITNAAIDASKLAAAAVTNVALATNAVASANIQVAAVTSAIIANNAVQTANIAALAVTAAEVANATLTGAKIAAATITAGNIVSGTITTTQIAAGTITAINIAAGTITATQIAAGTITATQLAAGSVTTAKIAAGAVTATEIAANTITSAKMVAGSITARELVITDYSNMIPDADLTNKANNWADGYGSNYSSVTFSSGINGFRAGNACFFNAPIVGGVGGYCSGLMSGYVPVTPGEQIAVGFSSGLGTGGDGDLYQDIVWKTAAGALSASAGLVGTSGGPYSQILTVPSTAAFASWRCYRRSNGAGIATANYAYIHSIFMRKAAAGNLIVDGAITAAKIAANTITANEIAANTITAAKIAAGAIGATQLAAGAITAGKISAGAIDTSSLMVNGVVITAKIAAQNAVNLQTANVTTGARAHVTAYSTGGSSLLGTFNVTIANYQSLIAGYFDFTCDASAANTTYYARLMIDLGGLGQLQLDERSEVLSAGNRRTWQLQAQILPPNGTYAVYMQWHTLTLSGLNITVNGGRVSASTPLT